MGSRNSMSGNESMTSSNSNKTMEKLMCASMATMSVSEGPTLAGINENTVFTNESSSKKSGGDSDMDDMDVASLPFSVGSSIMHGLSDTASVDVVSNLTDPSGMKSLSSTEMEIIDFLESMSPASVIPGTKLGIDQSAIFQTLCQTVSLAIGDVSPVREMPLFKVLKAMETTTTLRYLDFSCTLCKNGQVDAILLVLAKASETNTVLLFLKHDARLPSGPRSQSRYLVRNKGAEALAKALETDSMLQHLELCSNSIGDKGAAAVAKALKSNKALKYLDLSNNLIGDEGAEALAKALTCNTALEKLDLNVNCVRFAGAAALAEVLESNNTTLQYLYIGATFIGDKGAVALAKTLETNVSLLHLGLHFNSIGDVGVTELAKALGVNTTLLHLDIRFNSFGDVGDIALFKAMKDRNGQLSVTNHYDLGGEIDSLEEQSLPEARVPVPTSHLAHKFSPSEDERIYVEEGNISDKDIIGGSDSTGSAHPGNVSYRRMVQENKSLHNALGRRHKEKTKIRDMIFDTVVNHGGRFIKKENGQFYLLTEKEAQRKVTEALKPRKSRAKKAAGVPSFVGREAKRN